MNRYSALRAACLLTLTLGCASHAPFTNPRPTTGGVLFIAGGAVKKQGPVLTRFFEEADKAASRRGHGTTSVEIIPVASGDPAGSLQHNRDIFTQMAPTIHVDGLPLSHENPEAANDPTIAARFQAASAVWFTGGDQSRITSLFKTKTDPYSEAQTQPPLIELATSRMLHAGGLIGGSSAGAAMMSDPMISGGRSEGALLNGGAKGGVRTKPGLGYFPFGLVDQHFLARGRMGRLLVAMAIHSERFGFGVEENSAMVVSLGASPIIEVVGPSGLCVLDLGRPLKLQGPRPYDGAALPEVWEFELSLLGTGDRWDPVAGKAIPHPDRVPHAGIVKCQTHKGVTLNPWESGALVKALFRLSLSPDTPQESQSQSRRVVLSAASHSSFLFRRSHSSDIFASGIQIRVSKL